MKKITYCIPSKNNLRYLKTSIEAIKKESTGEYDIVVFVDEDKDGTVEWLIQNNITYLQNDAPKAKGIAYAYNRCIEAATTEIVCMYHADMIMGPSFDKFLQKHLIPGTVVSATRIEPPLHPEGVEKIVRNFGLYPEEFQEIKFREYVKELQETHVDKTTQGIFAPWAAYKTDLLAVGLHDEMFHSYHEDSDIFNRFVLAGYKLVQTWEAYVYHLTCRGGQFQDGVEKVTTDAVFHSMKNNAFRNYARKWGVKILHDPYMYPIVVPKLDVGFVIPNCTPNLLELLEPWCSKIWVDCTFEQYIVTEQKNTPYSLEDRVRTLDSKEYSKYPNVILFDGTSFSIRHYTDFIQNVLFVLQDVRDPGVYNWDRFIITVNAT